MKLLHTGDWHAGRTLARHKLDDALTHSLLQMSDFAVKEKVDAVLVAGDIFDNGRPLGPSQEIVFDFFLRLYKEDIPAVVVAGNHDSSGQWSALSPLLKLANVHTVARPCTTSSLTLDTKNGPLHVAALAWPTERLLAPLVDPASGEHDQQKMTWADRVGRLIEILCEKMPKTGPRIFVSHLMVNGSIVSCTERPMSITDTYAISGQAFPAYLNYAALGHVHKPQAVSAPTKACYSGAPCAMDFGEADEERGFYCSRVAQGRHTETEFIRLDQKLPLKVVEVPIEGLESALQEHKAWCGYLKVCVQVDQPEVALADRVRQELPQAIIVRTVRRGQTTSPEGEQIRLLDPIETFRQFCLSEGSEPTADLETAFQELYEEASR